MESRRGPALDREDTVAAMGSVKQALGGNSVFYSVVFFLSGGVIGDGVFPFPSNPAAGDGALRGAARLLVLGFVLWERLLFFLPGELCLLGQSAIRRRLPK